MFSLRRPDLLVLSSVDFVETILDPRHLFKVKRTESSMFESFKYEFSSVLNMYSALVQLGSCEAQHRSVNQCKNKKKLGHSSVSLDREEQEK